MHYKSDSEVATLLTEFSESTSLQRYLNAAQEEVDGYLRDAKFKMVKEILKAVCDKLDSQVFQVVPSVSQNPLSINSDQAGFGAEELSRGLERAPNARPSALLFSSPTSDLSYYALCNRD